ncbi:MAG: helix-turn-helix transcriptional regulator [Thermoplasmata archaeon]|nr:helix-turn-helix transcriptional regulator [Thermoplasmata archaeon]
MVFLTHIGYLPKGYEPRTSANSVKESVPFRLFFDCFLGRMDKVWTIEQLAHRLKTTKPTIYRHINKLKSIDLLEEASSSDKGNRKGYRIRYGNLTKAWNFVESHVEITMENYRKSIDHIQSLTEKKK